MKNKLFLLPFLLFSIVTQAQIEKVVVEKYYVSDAKDATDTIDGSARKLDSGSVTYRVYIDLKPGFKVKKIYGDANHRMKISSTTDFYNNVDRPSVAYFGYLINKSWFNANPTIALDSWLTLGLATKAHMGVLKADDTDGSIIGGTHNAGGTAAVSGGLLTNTVNVGVPFTIADGLRTNTVVTTQWQWIDNGFKDISNGNADTTVFGSIKKGSQFISNDAYLQQTTGVGGTDPDSNRVLVAQLTTTGELSFELNVELLDSLGNTLKYVGNNDTILTGEVFNPYLKYPTVFVCGCPDPNYLEYSAVRDCDSQDSCHHLIVFGCMDPSACNYDPNANFNLPDLCCYPGSCQDRDINVVCPSLSVHEQENVPVFDLFPNPASDKLNIQISFPGKKETGYSIIDAHGKLILERSIKTMSGNISYEEDISNLASGLYLFMVRTEGNYNSKFFIKD